MIFHYRDSFHPRSTKKKRNDWRNNTDIHRFEQTSKLSSVCSAKEAKEKKCYGGFARLATLIRQARKSSVPCLFLNAGDTYQGSIWYNVYKWKIVAKLMNLLAPNATVRCQDQLLLLLRSFQIEIIIFLFIRSVASSWFEFLKIRNRLMLVGMIRRI